MPTLKENLENWVENNEVLAHEAEIISFIQESDNDLDELEFFDDQSILFLAAKHGYKTILIETLKRHDAAALINKIFSDLKSTPLSISIYNGNHEIASLLLIANALIEVSDNNNVVNAYEALGEGYWDFPTDAEDYRKIFQSLLMKDANKPKRKYFSDKYNATKNNAYLACVKLYDEIKSKKKDQWDKLYKTRDILTVEDFSVRKFFRYDENIHMSGIANFLALQFFSNNTTVIDGYLSRSIIIVLVDKMRKTTSATVQNALNSSNDLFADSRRLFSSKFSLGSTQFLYEWRPCEWQRGNCILKVNMASPESFGANLSKNLEELTNTDGNNQKTNQRSKKLGQLLLEKTKQLHTFYHHEFIYHQNKLRIRIHRDSKDKKSIATLAQAQAMIHKLNGLLILWSIVEPARRLSGHEAPIPQQNAPNAVKQKRKKAINIDHIPIATMQIRALQLLSEGMISIKDIFGHSAKYAQPPYNNADHRAEYGVSTAKNVVDTFDEVKNKAKKLSEIDLPHLSLASKNSWFSRNYSKQILVDGYGSGNESSDNDYSDDEFVAPNSFVWL